LTAIFAVVIDGPVSTEREWLKGWGLACLAWDIDELWYVDRTKDGPLGPMQFHERRLKAREVESFQAALDDAKDLKVVAVEGPVPVGCSPVELRSYAHPRDALYCFGGNRSAGLWPALAKVEADWLTIPARRGLRAHQAGDVVAFHRYLQSNRLR
jgi:hypothetical protein